MIKKILIPLDGSQSADHALDVGLDLAGKYSAEVMVITVFDSPRPSLLAKGMLYAPASTEKYLEELSNFNDRILSEALKKAIEFKPKIRVSKKLVEGRPADK